MIVKVFHRERKDGVKLFRTYSDKECMIKQVETGAKFIEAIDVEDAPFTYEETDELIKKDMVMT